MDKVETPRSIIDSCVKMKKKWEQAVATARSLELAVRTDESWKWCQDVNMVSVKDRYHPLPLQPFQFFGIDKSKCFVNLFGFVIIDDS